MGPLSNPSPSNKWPAYYPRGEDGAEPVMRESDGSAVKSAMTKHGIKPNPPQTTRKGG